MVRTKKKKTNRKGEQRRPREAPTCGKCGGPMYVDTLPDDGPRRSFREWTCLKCGQTLYPRSATEQGR